MLSLYQRTWLLIQVWFSVCDWQPGSTRQYTVILACTVAVYVYIYFVNIHDQLWTAQGGPSRNILCWPWCGGYSRFAFTIWGHAQFSPCCAALQRFMEERFSWTGLQTGSETTLGTCYCCLVLYFCHWHYYARQASSNCSALGRASGSLPVKCIPTVIYSGV